MPLIRRLRILRLNRIYFPANIKQTKKRTSLTGDQGNYYYSEDNHEYSDDDNDDRERILQIANNNGLLDHLKRFGKSVWRDTRNHISYVK